MLTKNRKANLAVLPILMLLVAFVLNACGESPTAPSPTPTQPSTPTTAPTTAPVAATATTTSAAGGSSSGTPAASGGSTVTLPAINGATEVTLDPAIVQPVIKQFGLANATVKFYTSDNPASSVVDTADAAIVGAGYAFSIPGATKPTQSGGTYAGLYTKANAADIVLAAVDVPSDPTQLATQLNIPGVTADVVQKLADQIKGKKSVLFIVAAPGLLQAIFNGLGGSTTSDATATPTK